MVVTWFSDGQPSYNTMVDIDTNMVNHVSTLFTEPEFQKLLQGLVSHELTTYLSTFNQFKLKGYLH